MDLYTPRFARLVRGQVLSLRKELFVEPLVTLVIRI
jgi:ABC-type dipeptide/oligopeptide/nickel transport system permease subunit